MSDAGRTKPKPEIASFAPIMGTLEYAQAIVETIRQPLVVLDETFRVCFANPAFYRHFRIGSDDVMGCEFWLLDRGQWNTPELRRVLDRVLNLCETIEDLEVRYAVDDLGIRTFLLNARHVSLDEREYPLVLIALEDVTERRRAEAAAAEHSRQLERSNRDLEEFAHAASHDLQEPLRKVRTFADRFVSTIDQDLLDERQRLYLERMHDAAARMQARIDDLLGLARVSRRTPQREVVELSTVVRSALRNLENAIAESGAIVDVGPLPTIEGDAAHLELVFQNMVSNAIKYRRSDVPPLIHIQSESVPAPPPDDRAWISVRVVDNGIGFEQEYARRIFRPFERLHGRGDYEGSGVGLSICQRVIELHGGSITATSKPGAGATFEIRLPATHREPEA